MYVAMTSDSILTNEVSYRDLQVGWGTVAELRVTEANIIGHNTVHFYSLEIQLCASCGYQL